jgi:large subunit ribosomal protein L3
VSDSKIQEGVATGILGKKLGMTQVFINDERVPVTVIQAGPCVVVQVKTEETDGYNAVQLGMDEKKPKRTTRPEMGHFYKAGVTPKKLVREFRAASAVTLQPGQEVGASVLEGATLLDVQGISKGKGFAGVMKRYGWGGGRASHGNSKYHRMPGSLGRTYSVHKGVPKNRKGPGRLGGETVTVRGLKLVEIDAEKNIVLIRGSVPGANGSYVILRRSVKDPSRRKPPADLLY